MAPARMEGVGMFDTRRRVARTVWDAAMGSVVGLMSGAASAGFMFLLGRAVRLRENHLWLLWLLPVFGLISAWLYHRYGKGAEGGGGLILDEVIEFRGRVPSRMAPLVLIGTLLSHLGGASVGREGTAIQMGASLARTFGKLPWSWLRLNQSPQRLLLMAGVSAGFGSLFGAPAAGAVFGMEVIAIGKLHYEGIVICGAASFVGDWVCRGLGAHHEHFHALALPLTPGLGLKLALFAVPVALVAGSFSEFAHGLARWTRARWPAWWLRPLIGGVAFICLTVLFRTTDFLNLGTVWLPRIYDGAHVPFWAFAAKAAFTVLCLGFGFKGGEVTPLFVIGALLGTALAPLFGLPPPFLATIGFIALFAAASNTPLASTLMGIELFGGAFIAPLALTCALAYVLVGHRGIYGGHRVHTSKQP